MRFKNLIVKLGATNSSDKTELKYDIFSSKAAEIWSTCIQKARSSGFYENNRFYGFVNQKRSQLESLLDELGDVVSELKGLHPELLFPEIDKSDILNSVKKLHYEFAHSHHVTNRINEANEKIWARFNLILHSIENVFLTDKLLNEMDLALSRIVFTWNDNHRTEIPTESLKDFTTSMQFGTIYINYAQVGRHLFEMYMAADDLLDDQHIQPFKYISGDSNMYFGPSLDESSKKN